MIVSSIFSFISLLVFYFSPTEYSFTFSVFCLLFYLLINFYYFKFVSKDKGVGFEYFYMIAFCMTNFIYPVFYFMENRYVSLFSYPFNFGIISKATALALVAYAFYILGLQLYRRKKDALEFKVDSFYPLMYMLISIISFIFFVIFGGLDHFKSVYSGDSEWEAVGSYSYFYLIFNYSSLLLSMFLFKCENKKIMIFGALYLLVAILLLLLSGSRMTSVGIVLVLLVSFSKNIKNIPSLIATFFVLFSSVFLYSMMIYRSNMFSSDIDNIAGSAFSSNYSLFDSFMDLIVNNRNLYVLVDFVDSNGSVFFANIFYNIISFLPFSKSINDFFGIPEFLNGNLPSFLEFGSNAGFGLGTNNVGEAYLSFGLVGVIVFFTFFGVFLKFLKEKSSSSIISYIFYFILVSNAVIYPRGNVLINTRVFVWTILIFFMIYLLRKILVKAKV